MMEKTTQSVGNLGYHAHIYYDPKDTRAVAERVCAALSEKFPVEINGFRDTPVGPHPIANVLVIFKPDQFEHVVTHLMVNRDGLDVLVHPLTKDAVEDHSSFAIWLGNSRMLTAKMIGMTPAWLTRSGRNVEPPWYMRRPRTRLAYWTGIRRWPSWM